MTYNIGKTGWMIRWLLAVFITGIDFYFRCSWDLLVFASLLNSAGLFYPEYKKFFIEHLYFKKKCSVVSV